jgi:hypothetical protein
MLIYTLWVGRRVRLKGDLTDLTTIWNGMGPLRDPPKLTPLGGRA